MVHGNFAGEWWHSLRTMVLPSIRVPCELHGDIHVTVFSAILVSIGAPATHRWKYSPGQALMAPGFPLTKELLSHRVLFLRWFFGAE
jgi:hypothetical protein